jgi:3-oxoacyl-ACP reductase-like protein
MGMFSKILSKLGIKKDEEKNASASMSKQSAPPASSPKPAPRKAPARPAAAKPSAGMKSGASDHLAENRAMLERKHAAAASVPMVDVMSKLETMARGSGLDWKVSIVDLLKVLGIDSSSEARKELAEELGCPPEIMSGDSAKRNVWLHKKVLAEIAENGGNIPQELLD